MSKHNKTNKSNYVQAGRLTPDDMARERTKMRTVRGVAARGEEETGKGMKHRTSAPGVRISGGESARRSRRSGSAE